MDRESLRNKVQTVRGLIVPDALGPTLMHEHLLCDVTQPGLAAADGEEVEITLENVWEINYTWGTHHLGNSRILNRDVAVREMRRLRDDGGRSIVELTNHGLRRDALGLREIAELADVNVVMGCGRYIDAFLSPEVRDQGVDEIARDIVGDILEGVRDSDVRAGIIGEIGCSWPWTEAERRSMRGAVIAQQETGGAITVHPGRHVESLFEVVRFVDQAGGDVSRTIIGHVDRTITDIEDLIRLADTGCVIEYDLFGIEGTLYPFSELLLPNDGARLRAIRVLVDRGHLDRIVISQDICTRTRQTEFGGHGYGHIYRNVVPFMSRVGFDEDEIDTILVGNPARLLAFQ